MDPGEKALCRLLFVRCDKRHGKTIQQCVFRAYVNRVPLLFASLILQFPQKLAGMKRIGGDFFYAFGNGVQSAALTFGIAQKCFGLFVKEDTVDRGIDGIGLADMNGTQGRTQRKGGISDRKNRAADGDRCDAAAAKSAGANSQHRGGKNHLRDGRGTEKGARADFRDRFSCGTLRRNPNDAVGAASKPDNGASALCVRSEIQALAVACPVIGQGEIDLAIGVFGLVFGRGRGGHGFLALLIGTDNERDGDRGGDGKDNRQSNDNNFFKKFHGRDTDFLSIKIPKERPRAAPFFNITIICKICQLKESRFFRNRPTESGKKEGQKSPFGKVPQKVRKWERNPTQGGSLGCPTMAGRGADVRIQNKNARQRMARDIDLTAKKCYNNKNNKIRLCSERMLV